VTDARYPFEVALPIENIEGILRDALADCGVQIEQPWMPTSLNLTRDSADEYPVKVSHITFPAPSSLIMIALSCRSSCRDLPTVITPTSIELFTQSIWLDATVWQLIDSLYAPALSIMKAFFRSKVMGERSNRRENGQSTAR
jgi:hypothetical protein